MLRSKRMLGFLGLLLFFGCGPLGPASTAALLLSGSSSKKDSKKRLQNYRRCIPNHHKIPA